MKQSFNFYDAMNADLAKNEQLLNGVPESVGMFDIKSANQTIIDAKQLPNPESLWLSLFIEGENCCLFADSNVGKSIYAVQIGTEIAKHRKVLYFDFEQSDKQFQLRYTDDDGNLFRFPDNLFRVTINPEKYNCDSFEDSITTDIENAVIQTDAKILIIDNLSYLCIAAEKSDLAGRLMQRLVGLKKQYGLSILVLAHTPKRPLTEPITQNHLAGSKKLFNFFDSAFAIGKSAKDPNLRYIKQIKVRSVIKGCPLYDADNVIVCSIEKENAFLQFVQIGFETEREHLKEQSETDREQLSENVKDLSREGKSIRDIARELHIGKSTVQRILNPKK